MSLQEAVQLLFNNWQALNLAKQMGWGGIQTEEKIEWFKGVVVDWIEEKRRADIDELEEILLQIMQDEFDSWVQDGSAMRLAKDMAMIYNELKDGELRMLDILRSQNRPNIAVVGQGSHGTDDEESDKDEEMEEAQPPKPKKKEKVIDEDGWELVQRK